ncbi:MAG TPA: cyanophycin synthetase, partial [Armatimonadota bacterium]|nr:cyanophycin synthetase [Armatimonadota bacterium]
ARVEAVTPARAVRVSTERPAPGGVYCADGWIISEVQGAAKRVMAVSAIRLKGAHNLANVLQAVAAVEALGLPAETVAAAVLSAFRGVPNRLEEVDTLDGVTFYNDSQGTTPAAVEVALRAFAPARPVLIAGGRPKITDFSELGRIIAERAQAVILIGEAADVLETAIRAAAPDFPIHRAPSLPDAVRQGFALAKPDGLVLLSPACASFDMFRNMEHRGEVFRQAVAHLRD